MANRVTSKTKKTKEKPALVERRFSVYLGPNITGVITYGAIIPLPKEKALASLEAAITRYPEIARLIVSDVELSEARVQVKTPGTLLNSYYNKLARSGQ